MADQVVLELYNPSGALESPEHHARRLETLHGKTICELSNASWEPHRMYPVIREAIKGKFPDARIVPHTEFPEGNNKIDVDDIGKLLKEKGCDAVISGNAG